MSSAMVVLAQVSPNVPKIIDKIHGMMLVDRKLKDREATEVVGILTERAHHMLHEYFNMKKLSAGLLTIDHKHNRVTTSKD